MDNPMRISICIYVSVAIALAVSACVMTEIRVVVRACPQLSDRETEGQTVRQNAN